MLRRLPSLRWVPSVWFPNIVGTIESLRLLLARPAALVWTRAAVLAPGISSLRLATSLTLAAAWPGSPLGLRGHLRERHAGLPGSWWILARSLRSPTPVRPHRLAFSTARWCLLLFQKHRPGRHADFGAQSRSSRARCVRFTASIALAAQHSLVPGSPTRHAGFQPAGSHRRFQRWQASSFTSLLLAHWKSS